jgi:predicted amidohydrolase
MFAQIVMSPVESLIATTGPSVWGILFVVIILVAAALNAFGRFRAGKVAMCQIFILDGDRRGNFVRIENAVAEAKGKGADIICFPAATMLGWVNPDAHEKAFPIPGPDSDLLCELAKKYKAFLCVGLEEKEGDKLFNSAILIDDRGQILLKHREINIAPNLMNPPYTAGSDVGITDTKLGKTGLLMCSDTQQEDILDRMAAFKPALLLVPCAYAEEKAKWPGHGQELQRVVKNAAIRTRATVVGTNLLGQITKGPWAGRIYGGQSVAADNTGKILAIAKDRDRDIRLVSVKATP